MVTASLLTGGAWLACARETENSQEKRETKTAAVSQEARQSMKEGVEAMRRKDWKRAETAWGKLVKQEPGNAGAWANLGKVTLQQNDTEAAIAALEKAVALQPALAEAWMALGMAYDREGAAMRAISCLTRAVHENPADPRVHNSLAIVLKKTGWAGAAESELQKALDLDPRYAEAHFNLAVLYLERRPPSLELARRHYESARSFGAEPDKEMEAQLATGLPGVEEKPAAPPAPKTGAPLDKKSPTKTTRSAP